MEQLKVLRVANKLSQMEFANLLNMSKPNYNKIENGQVKLTVEDLKKICNYFKISADVFLNLNDNNILVSLNKQEILDINNLVNKINLQFNIQNNTNIDNSTTINDNSTKFEFGNDNKFNGNVMIGDNPKIIGGISYEDTKKGKK